MNLDLQSDDTVDGSMIIAISEQLATMAGEDPEAFAQQMADEVMSGADEFGDATTYNQDGYIGTEVKFSDMPISDMSGTGTDSLTIERNGDTFVVTGTMDMSGDDMGIDPNDPTMSSFTDTFDVQVSVTFPGKVITQTGGEVKGNTVTWKPAIGSSTEIYAEGSATGGGAGFPMWIIFVVVGVLIVAAVIIILVVRSNNKKKAAAAIPGAATMPGVPGIDPTYPAAPVADPGTYQAPAAPVAEPGSYQAPTMPAAPAEPPAVPAPGDYVAPAMPPAAPAAPPAMPPAPPAMPPAAPPAMPPAVPPAPTEATPDERPEDNPPVVPPAPPTI